MSNVIYQPTAGRLRIDNRDYPLSELVMDYLNSNQDTYLVTIKDRILGTVIKNVALSEIEDNVGGTYVNIAAWTAWWEALDFGSSTAPAGGATSVKQDLILAKIEELKEKQFPTAIYILSDTNASAEDDYTGFYALESDTEIDAIEGIDTNLVKGDNDFSGVTFQPGTFVEVPGGFTKMTLSAGAMALVIESSE